MNNLMVRKIIREEVKRKVAQKTFGKDFEYLIKEASLNEFDMSGFDLSGLFKSGLGFIEDNIGQAGIDSVKQMIIEGIFSFLDDMQFPISKDSIMGGVLINVIENLSAADMADYFTDGGCEKVADRIIKGIQEGLQEDAVINKLLETLMGPGAKLEGIIGSPIRELINIKLNDMTEFLRKPLVDFACNHRDFKKLLGDFKSASAYSRSNSPSEFQSGDLKGASPVPKTLLRMKQS